jgi:DNA-binding NtrC family response regulator
MVHLTIQPSLLFPCLVFNEITSLRSKYFSLLRDRAEDIPLLADYFLKKYCEEKGLPEKRLSSGAIEQLMAHNWPGNIRELKSIIEKIVEYNKDNRIINPSDIEIDDSGPNYNWRELDELNYLHLNEAKREFERRYLKYLLNSTKSQAEAARRAGIDRSNFNKLLKKYELSD